MTGDSNGNHNSSLADKITRQIEFYFGDVNLNKDKFMKEEIQKDCGCKL
jgi:hypothetical protein